MTSITNLMLKYPWLSAWNSDSVYQTDESVIFNGKIYFCLQDHKAEQPNPLSDSFFWRSTEVFQWEASLFASNEVKVGMINNAMNFEPLTLSYHIKKNKKKSSKQQFNLSFSDCNLHRYRAINLFLSLYHGSPFRIKLPQPIDATMFCRCSEWENSYIYYDNYLIRASITEVYYGD